MGSIDQANQAGQQAPVTPPVTQPEQPAKPEQPDKPEKPDKPEQPDKPE